MAGGKLKNQPTGHIKVMWFKDLQGNPVSGRYREGTTDEKALREVVERRSYRRLSAGIDVEPGETWLDLGANIGSFAVYCKVRQATAVCYEPDEDCFRILQRNANGFVCYRKAVTAHQGETVSFYVSKESGNHYRGSILTARSMKSAGSVPNIYAGLLLGQTYDGIKIDIEGAEFDLIDLNLIPFCNKLVMEYHTSRDPSVTNLKRRIEILKRRFRQVIYPPEFDRQIQAGSVVKTFFDRFIYCKEPL